MAEIAATKDIFGTASELPPGERGPYLDRACAGDHALRARVDSLLRAFDEGGVFLSQPTPPNRGEEPTSAARPREFAAPPPRPPPEPPIAESPGSTIGRYRLLQQIGEGGFGVVFMAEQRDPVVRKVALKIIKLGMDTRQVIARFEAERQALALMDHPCIARVLDAGATGTGRPYFVMELVRGEPITPYCDRNNLSPHERLELFVQVCQAVQHAHTKGIIHRDLKPSNVLVTMVDGRPVPKVIDFGIAKATSARLTEKTIFTEFRQMVGTPEYMSPEQAEMSGVDVDTRTDIYSLGVLLYELLIGVTPFDAGKLRSAAWGELQRIIREEEPSKPSTRLSTMKDTIASVAARRRTEPARLSRLVRGDLDWIVMKCLEKSRARRYETASGLAADVRRHLDGEAVLAAPPGAAYRVRKFVRRHRLAVGVGAGLAVVLALGAVGTGIGLVRAAAANRQLDDALRSARAQRDLATGSLEGIARRFTHEPALSAGAGAEPEIKLGDLGVGMAGDRAVEALGQTATRLVDGLVQARRQAAGEAEGARREAAKARAVTDFLQRLVEGASPEKALTNREVTVRQVVDRSAADLDSGRARLDPDIEATVRGALGRLYRALGDPAESKKHLDRAIALGAAGSLSKGEVATLRNDLGNALRDLGDIDGAAAAYRQALADATGADGPRAATAGGAYNSLAGIAMLRGRLDEAGDLYARALEIMQGAREGDDRELLQIINNQAVLADKRGRPDEAERLLAPLLERARAALGEDDPFVAGTMLNLGVAHGKQGRFDRALVLIRDAEQLMRKLYGDKHPRTLGALSQLGGLALFAGDPAEAERAYGAALEGLRALSGEAGGDLLDALRGYSVALEFQGRPEQAESTRRELVDVARAGSRPPAELATHVANLGQNLLSQRRWAEAETVLRECISIRRGLFKEGSPQVWSLRIAESALGESLMEQAADLATDRPGTGADPAAAGAKFAEAEPLVVNAAESVPGDPNTPKPIPRGPDRARQTLERAARLYELWQRLADDPQRREKAAAWKDRLDSFDAARSGPGH